MTSHPQSPSFSPDLILLNRRARRYQPQKLGGLLVEAGLITPGQLEVALYEQSVHKYRLGEILCHHGWVQEETIHFFVECWPRLFEDSLIHPIGYYLQQAGLMSAEQVQVVLASQRQIGTRFGLTAVVKGFLRQKTLDFFLRNLSQRAQNSQIQGITFKPSSRFTSQARNQPAV